MMPVLALSKSLFNLFLVSCIITPLAVSYWRGTWYILDLFVFPEDKCFSAWITFAASFGVIYLIMLVEDYLKAFLNERKAKRVWYLVMFYPLAFLIVTSWRALWMLLDYYTTSSLTSGCVSHAVGFFIVSSLKTTSTVIAVPGYCISERNVDPSESFLEGKICFRSKTCQNYWADIASRMANSFVTVFVIGSGGICYWRGTWIIVKSIKHPACPENNLIPSIIAISQGFAVLSICFCLSEFITTKRLDHPFPAWCRALEVVFVYILGFGVVTTWVGLWFLEDIYLFPG